MFRCSCPLINIPCVLIVSCSSIAGKLISSSSIRTKAEESLFQLNFCVEAEEKVTNTAPLGGSCHGLDLQNVLQGAFKATSIPGCKDFITLNGLFQAAVLIYEIPAFPHPAPTYQLNKIYETSLVYYSPQIFFLVCHVL